MGTWPLANDETGKAPAAATRVDPEHRRLDRYARWHGVTRCAGILDSTGDWSRLLKAFAQDAASKG
jgi:hypothetical protein